MKFELRSNGQVEILLIPETEIETAFVAAFTAVAKKGGTARLGESPGALGALVVSTEK